MDINVHGTKTISLGPIESHEVEETGRVFYIRKITVDSERGRVEVTLFSDDKTTLSI